MMDKKEAFNIEWNSFCDPSNPIGFFSPESALLKNELTSFEFPADSKKDIVDYM
jgi:hypothetical protein